MTKTRPASEPDPPERWRAAWWPLGFSSLRRTPFRDRQTESEASRMGLLLMLASLATVFGATIIAVISVRLLGAAPDRWRPSDDAGLPWELLLSTALIGVGSVTIELARREIGRDRTDRAARWLRITTASGILFMLSQVWCWIRIIGAGLPPTESLYGWIFTVMTVLHALHVLVGLAILGLVALRAEAGQYTASRRDGIDGAALYWHFLGVVWVILLITLWAVA